MVNRATIVVAALLLSTVPACNDPCAPYTGSYSGLLPYRWTDGTKNPPTQGTGQISIKFTASCLVGGPGTIQLDVTSATSDFAGYGATTPTSVFGGMQMPENPPASGDKRTGITINFPNRRVLNINGPLTVTSGIAGRLIIANDLTNTNGWSEGGLPGVPPTAGVTSYTYQIDRD